MTECRVGPAAPSRLALVRGHLPVMAGIRAEAAVTRPLSGHRISGCVPLTQETGVLVEALLAAGAEVAWTSGPADDVVGELAALGARVTRREDTGSRRDPRREVDVLDAFPGGPTLLVDRGALLSETVRSRPARFPDLVAAAETTVEGSARIGAWHRRHTLTFPVTSVVAAGLGDDAEDGVGPSVVDGIVRTTGVSLAGKRFVVAGFDRVGRDIAVRARELGARVFVSCDSDGAAVRAALAGFDVLPPAGAAPVGDVVCRTDRRPAPLAPPRLRRLPGGAILCDLSAADEPAPDRTAGVDERADLWLARLALTLVRCAARGPGRVPGLHRVSREHEAELARRKLAALNVAVDRLPDRVRAGRTAPARWSRPVPTGRNSGRPIGAALRLEQAARRMPLLAALRRDFAPVAPLGGQRVAVRGDLTAETATAALTLVELGAEVAWSGDAPGPGGEETAELVRRPRLTVHTAPGRGPGEALRVWPQGPTLVLDDAGVLLDALHREPGGTRWPVLAVERTLDGAALSAGLPAPRLPVLTGEGSFARQVVDDLCGPARALLQAIGAVVGRPLPGKVFVVAGFGRLGAQVAAEARRLGARVVVTEVDPVRALRAVLDGFPVLPMAAAARTGDFFCTVTDTPDVIRRQHLAAMKSGAVLANAGHPRAVDRGTLGRMTVRWPVSPAGVRLYDLVDGRRLHLIDDALVTDGASAGESLPEALDIVLAGQVLAACLALPRAWDLSPGVHPQPADCDRYVAAELAAGLGVARPSPAPHTSEVVT